MRRGIIICGLLAALMLSGCRYDEMSAQTGYSEPTDTVQEKEAEPVAAVQEEAAEPAKNYDEWRRVPAKMSLEPEPRVYADSSGIAEGYYRVRGRKDLYDIYRAYSPGIVQATFCVIDTAKNYETGFVCYLEKQEDDGQWYRVVPLGGEISQINKGSGHFYNIDETGRDFATFDLAAYPLLPPGNYRLAKPFWEEGCSDHEQYMVFYEFSMAEDEGSWDHSIPGSAECGQEEYTSDVREITYTVDTENISYVISDTNDIERLENGEWVSVMTGAVSANSIGGGYALRFIDTVNTVSTGSFDLSEPGEYRIRISIGKFDIETELIMSIRVRYYDTVYAYFRIV